MKRIILFLGAMALAAISAEAAAYKEITHDALTRHAADQSFANDPESGVLQSLFLGHHLNDGRFVLPKSGNARVRLTPRQLLAAGAREEDEQERPLNHFFDPQQGGIPLTIAYREWGDASPNWALEDAGPVDGQEFSYRDAVDYLHRAMTGLTETERSRALANVFEALGHVVHHIQDMTQPQHVRNDDHCDEVVPFFVFSLYSFDYVSPSRCQILGRYHPSAYEEYVRDLGPTTLGSYPTPDLATFESPRAFWDGAGMGSAGFTTRNFVTVDTNFTLDVEATPFVIRSDADHALPKGADARLVSYEINDYQLFRRVTDPLPMAGHVSFVETPISDAYRPERGGSNPYTSTLSILYDSVVLGTGEVQATPYPTFTLNSINYQAAAEHLLPRATAYSTGLINYFFRGRIEIGLPEQGVYGVLDHATTNAIGQGFDKLKLRLRNASPDGVKPSGDRVPQTMQGGTLVAVAKYTLNSCYKPDLSGDYSGNYFTGEIFAPADCSFVQYIAGDEQISQSAAILAASLDTVSATEMTFDFGSQPIPVNARDLRIQVVYTGPLGSETDAIAFGGRDISEPTHLVVYNNTDYFAVDGKLYTPAQIRADATLSQKTSGMNIDPRPLAAVGLSVVEGQPIAGLAGPVPVNGYVRVAVLGEKDAPLSLTILSRVEGAGYLKSSFEGIPTAVIDLRNDDGYITAYGIYRDPRGNFFDAVFKSNSDTPISVDELPLMSTYSGGGDQGPTPIPLLF